MSDLLQDVVIIGAGLGGCALALALSQHNIAVRLYEARPQDADALVSGVILTPNGLHILDRLGVLARIKDRCYKATHRVFIDRNDEITRKVQTSGEALYGYANHRVWRSVLLDEMKAMLVERSINIQYDAKFGGIVSDGPGGVDFRIRDNETQHASLLVGMDGIFSTVRKYLEPNISPEYTGTIAVLSHIKRASVAWPRDDYELHATIQDKPGAIFFLPEDPKGIDIMIGMQKRAPEFSRDDLDKLQQDKNKLVDFYRERHSEWGLTARSIIDQVAGNKEQCFIWPYLKVPTLPQWYSDTGRVILCGDSAHGLPPSSGQGINQALEDIYSLTLLLTSCGKRSNDSSERNARALDALAFWQHIRQTRIDAVFDWATNSTNVQRLSDDERAKLVNEGKTRLEQGDDMSWLYTPSLENDIQAWLEAHA